MTVIYKVTQLPPNVMRSCSWFNCINTASYIISQFDYTKMEQGVGRAYVCEVHHEDFLNAAAKDAKQMKFG